jgi:hypothetical protein
LTALAFSPGNLPLAVAGPNFAGDLFPWPFQYVYICVSVRANTWLALALVRSIKKEIFTLVPVSPARPLLARPSLRAHAVPPTWTFCRDRARWRHCFIGRAEFSGGGKEVAATPAGGPGQPRIERNDGYASLVECLLGSIIPISRHAYRLQWVWGDRPCAPPRKPPQLNMFSSALRGRLHGVPALAAFAIP